MRFIAPIPFYSLDSAKKCCVFQTKRRISYFTGCQEAEVLMCKLSLLFKQKLTQQTKAGLLSNICQLAHSPSPSRNILSSRLSLFLILSRKICHTLHLIDHFAVALQFGRNQYVLFFTSSPVACSAALDGTQPSPVKY